MATTKKDGALIKAPFKPLVLAIGPDAEKVKKSELALAKKIKAVATYPAQEKAVERVRSIKAFLAAFELGRKSVKKPVLDEAERIDTFAKTFREPLEKERVRLEGLISAHQQAEFQKVEAQRKKTEEAAQKLLKKSTEVKKPETAERYEDAAAVVLASAPEVAISAGAKTKKVWAWEVTDIYALVEARPELCTVPTPLALKVDKEIKDGARDIPGLRIFETLDTRVR